MHKIETVVKLLLILNIFKDFKMKVRQFLKLLLGSSLILLLFQPVVGLAEVKIGYVNTQNILKEAPQVKHAEEKLKKEFVEKDQGLKNLGGQLQQLESEYNANKLVMSESERKANERAILSMRRKLKQTEDEVREEYNFRYNEELEKLQKVILKAIVAIAKEEKYDLIVQNMVYVSSTIDITKKVLSKLAGGPPIGAAPKTESGAKKSGQ